MLYSLLFALTSLASLTSSQSIQKAVAVLVPNDMNRINGLRNVRGTVTFEVIPGAPGITFQPDVTRISGTIRGLQSNTEYGIHVHEFGDISSNDRNRPIDCLSTGNHYDPFNTHFHSDRNTEHGHLGDLGNIKSNRNGVARFDFQDRFITLDGKASVVGRGIVVHERRDDLTQPLGNAGGRPSCGVIGIAQNKKKNNRLIANAEPETTEYDQNMDDVNDDESDMMANDEYTTTQYPQDLDDEMDDEYTTTEYPQDLDDDINEFGAKQGRMRIDSSSQCLPRGSSCKPGPQCCGECVFEPLFNTGICHGNQFNKPGSCEPRGTLGCTPGPQCCGQCNSSLFGSFCS